MEAEWDFFLAHAAADGAAAEELYELLGSNARVFLDSRCLELGDDSITVAETHTLHYAVRLTKPGRVRVFLKLKEANLLAALPSRLTEEVLQLIAEV